MNEQGQRDILITFAKLFRQFKIQYLLTGSFAVSSYGYPRATHDIDFVLEIGQNAKKQLMRAVSSLPRAYIQDKSQLRDANLTFYTLYHTETATKVDLWLVADQEFSAKWKRRHVTRIGKLEITLVSPEDLILTKLLWCKEVSSERHMRDCVGMWKVQKDKLDEAYLFAGAKILGVESLLKKVIETKEY
jgi:hypothetical protein